MTIDINFTWLLILVVIGIALFLLHNGFNINLFVKKDEHIADKFFDKFPLVTSNFLQKTHREQTVENNQEIHELTQRVEHLEIYVQELNKKIDEKLNTILEEFQNRG